MVWLAERARGNLVASAAGVRGACENAVWTKLTGERLDWEEVFASTGLFGVELGEAATRLAGQVVFLRGFLSPPLDPEAGFFVLSRSPLPNCPFCNAGASWPDDIAVVHLRAAGAELEHPLQEVDVWGVLETGWAEGPQPGLGSWLRLHGAVWAVVAASS